jgi:predicted lysophospholipase L1 biosynthesis ABC-type transport system permease subunit
MLLVGLFASLALVLAAIGVHGVLSYDVARRVREIGIRMALGAERGSVLRLIVGRALLLTAIGVAAGGAGAFVLTRTLSTLLFGVTPHDPATFAAAAGILTVVALAAVLSVAAFDFFFVPPHLTFAVTDTVMVRWVAAVPPGVPSFVRVSAAESTSLQFVLPCCPMPTSLDAQGGSCSQCHVSDIFSFLLCFHDLSACLPCLYRYAFERRLAAAQGCQATPNVSAFNHP